MGVRWNRNVVLICISLVEKEAEHFLMYSLAIHISSFEKVSAQLICPFMDWIISSLGV
jgi:hypothetical protein